MRLTRNPLQLQAAMKAALGASQLASPVGSFRPARSRHSHGIMHFFARPYARKGGYNGLCDDANAWSQQPPAVGDTRHATKRHETGVLTHETGIFGLKGVIFGLFQGILTLETGV